MSERCSLVFFFFNDTATTEIYTLSLHDALPIFRDGTLDARTGALDWAVDRASEDRKSTRLNSSHGYISYAVFCLTKKKTTTFTTHNPHTPSTHPPTRTNHTPT